MAAVLYRGPFGEPCELEESEQRVSPRTPYLSLLAGVGERAPGFHLSSGDKSFNAARRDGEAAEAEAAANNQ